MSEENNLLVFPKIIKFMYFAATTFNHIKQFHRKLIKNLYRNIQLRWNIFFFDDSWHNIFLFILYFVKELKKYFTFSHAVRFTAERTLKMFTQKALYIFSLFLLVFSKIESWENILSFPWHIFFKREGLERD